jgi:hypothetical protein
MGTIAGRRTNGTILNAATAIPDVDRHRDPDNRRGTVQFWNEVRRGERERERERERGKKRDDKDLIGDLCPLNRALG